MLNIFFCNVFVIVVKSKYKYMDEYLLYVFAIPPTHNRTEALLGWKVVAHVHAK